MNAPYEEIKTDEEVVQPEQDQAEIINTLKKWWVKSRVIGLNLLVLVVALAGFVSGPDFPFHLSEQGMAWVLFIQSIANIILRFATNQPVSFRKP